MAPGSPPAKAAGWDNPGDVFENPVVDSVSNGKPAANGAAEDDSEEPRAAPVLASGHDQLGAGEFSPRGGLSRSLSPDSGRVAFDVDEERAQPEKMDKSLCLFVRDGSFRRACHAVRVSAELEYCVVFVAVVNSVLLAYDSPAFPPEGAAKTYVYAIELAVTAFFTVEVFIRVVDRGFIKGPDSYLSQRINQLDFLVVLASWFGLFMTKSSATNALRSLRMFRLFPTIQKLGTVHDIVEAVWESLDLIRDILGLLLFAIFAFGVVGMNFFGGLLSHRCEMEDESLLDLGDGSGSDDRGTTVVWRARESLECPPMLQCGAVLGTTGRCVELDQPFAVSDKEAYGNHGFDHIGQGLVSVFVQMTCDGGMQDMAHIIAYAVEGAASQSAIFAWPFFFCLVVVCSWVVLSLFTAVLSAEFAAVSARTAIRSKLEEDKEAASIKHNRESQRERYTQGATFDVEDDILSDEEREKMGPKVTPRQLSARKIADSPGFLAFIALCIVLSVASMFSFSERSESMESIIHTMDNVFILIFFVEFAVKVVAYTWRGYWADGANRFDLVILIITMGGLVLTLGAIGDTFGGSVDTQSFLSLRLPRLLRLIRMMRFMFMIDSVRAIFETVFSSWQKILSLCSFVVFMQCMFAVFGMQLLGGSLPLGTQETECWGGPMSGSVRDAKCGTDVEYTRRNFETFNSAFLTSFQYMTGEAWSQIMFWYGHHSAFGLPGAALFFMTLFLWQNCVSISLFVAIILDNFKLSEEEKINRQVEIYENDLKRASGYSDPYVEVSMLQEHTYTKKQYQLKKTPVKKNSIDPVWEDNNVFALDMHGRLATVVLTVMDWDLASSDDFLGEVRIELLRKAGNFVSPRPEKALSKDFDSSDVEDGEDLGGGEEYLMLRISSAYVDMDGNEQQKVDEFTLAGGESSEYERQLQQGLEWELEDQIKGQLSFRLEFETNDGAIMSAGEGSLHESHARIIVTVAAASNLLSDDSAINAEQKGMIAEAFPDEFDEALLPSAHEHHHANRAVTGSAACSLFIFGPTNPFRKLCVFLTENWVFDLLIMGCIVASCLVLAWEGPPGKMASSGNKETFDQINMSFCVIFAVEALMKIVALGFMFRTDPVKLPYFKDTLNRLDFFVVCVISFSYLMVIFDAGSDDSSAMGRSLRILRVLTPLRVAMRSERMRIIIRAFLLAVLPASAVFGVVMMFLVMFATVGTELFSGMLRRCCECSDSLEVVRAMTNGTIIETQAQCLFDEGHCWENPAYNFDTTMDSLQTLFKTMTCHGWVDIMESVADSNGEGFQPSKDAFIAGKAYFIVFHVIVTFFMLNLLVGVMATSFSEANMTNLFTDKQKEWVRERAILVLFSPREQPEWPEGTHEFRQKCKDIVDNIHFEELVVVAIIGNVSVLAMEHYPMSEGAKNLWSGTNTVFLCFFTLEIFLKMVGCGVKRYLRDAYCLTDLLVVVSCWLSLLIGVRSGFEVLRVLRVVRVFLVLNHFEGLMALFSTVMHSIPAAVDVCILSLLLFFIYAIVGMTIFGDAEVMDCDILCPGRLNRADNFENFAHAMQVLFQTTNGQCVYLLMFDLELRSGAGNFVVFVYFASFKFMSDFVFVNLVVGIILDTFDNTFSTEDTVFHADDLWAFREKWKAQALHYGEDLGVDATTMKRIEKNPAKVPLPLERMRSMIEQLVDDEVLRIGGDIHDWRGYLLLQLTLYASCDKKKKLGLRSNGNSGGSVSPRTRDADFNNALFESEDIAEDDENDGSSSPPSSNGNGYMYATNSPHKKGGVHLPKRWYDIFPAGGLDFDKSLIRMVQFELGKESIMYSERMAELELERRKVAQDMVQTVVRAWMWISISKTRPDNIPEDWRGKPNLFRITVIGIRNSRLEMLMRIQRYISGKASVDTLDRVKPQEAKLTKLEMIRQSSLLSAAASMDPAASLVGGVTSLAKVDLAQLAKDAKEKGESIANDAATLAKDTKEKGDLARASMSTPRRSTDQSPSNRLNGEPSIGATNGKNRMQAFAAFGGGKAAFSAGGVKSPPASPKKPASKKAPAAAEDDAGSTFEVD